MEATPFEIRDGIVIMHALSAAIGIGAVFTTDYLFIKFLRDYRVSEDEAKVMKSLSEVIWIALAILIFSGLYLALTKIGITDSPKFLLKMVVVGALFLNGLVLNLFITPRLTRVSFDDTHSTVGDEPDHIRKIAVMCGALSIFSWLSAFVLGSIKAIPFSFATGLAGYVGILTIIACGVLMSKKKRGTS